MNIIILLAQKKSEMYIYIYESVLEQYIHYFKFLLFSEFMNPSVILTVCASQVFSLHSSHKVKHQSESSLTRHVLQYQTNYYLLEQDVDSNNKRDSLCS